MPEFLPGLYSVAPVSSLIDGQSRSDENLGSKVSMQIFSGNVCAAFEPENEHHVAVYTAWLSSVPAAQVAVGVHTPGRGLSPVLCFVSPVSYCMDSLANL